MDTHRGEFRIETMCEVLRVSRSGYYAWRRRPRSQRDETNASSPRPSGGLTRRAAGSMDRRGLRSASTPWHRLRTPSRGSPDARRGDPFEDEAPVPLHRHEARGDAHRPEPPRALLYAPRANRVWASDITIVRTAEGWLHVAIVLDLFSRKIVGWAMSKTVTQTLRSKTCRWRSRIGVRTRALCITPIAGGSTCRPPTRNCSTSMERSAA